MANIKELKDAELNNVNGGVGYRPAEAYDEETMSMEKMNYYRISSSQLKTNTFKQEKINDPRLSQSKTLFQKISDDKHFHLIVSYAYRLFGIDK